MPDYISIPLQVLGYGVVISMGIAGLIKLLMLLIVKTGKSEEK